MTADEKPPETPISDSGSPPNHRDGANPAAEGVDGNSHRSTTGDLWSIPENKLEEAQMEESETPLVEAELVEPQIEAQQAGETSIVEATIATPSTPGGSFAPGGLNAAPPIARNLENLAANGGAIGAIVLGFWSLFGSFVTNWSMINGALGILLGLWGLTSNRRRLALIGIVVSAISIFLCLVQVSEYIGDYLNQPADPGY